MAELIQKQDTLNEGRVKINAAITDAEQAKNTSEEADVKATQALEKSESTQTQLDTIVINGDSSVEAAQARVDEKGVGHTTLKDRIDDGFTKVTSQLNEKADELYVANELSNKRDKSVKINKTDYDLSRDVNKWNINDLDENTRQAILESSDIDINYVLGVNGVVEENITPKSVTNDKLQSAQIGGNMFNKQTATKVLLSMTSDTEYPNEDYYSSDYMLGEGDTEYARRYQCRVIFYDESRNFISGTGESNPAPELGQSEPIYVTSPSNTKYIRVSFKSTNIKMLDSFQFVKGKSVGEYSPYYHKLNNTVTIDESRVSANETYFEYDNNNNLTKVIENGITTSFNYNNGFVTNIIINDIELGLTKQVNFTIDNGLVTKIKETFLGV